MMSCSVHGQVTLFSVLCMVEEGNPRIMDVILLGETLTGISFAPAQTRSQSSSPLHNGSLLYAETHSPGFHLEPACVFCARGNCRASNSGSERRAITGSHFRFGSVHSMVLDMKTSVQSARTSAFDRVHSCQRVLTNTHLDKTWYCKKTEKGKWIGRQFC